MAKPQPPNDEVLRSRVRRARREIREATGGIRKLMAKAKQGTLDRKALESGLKKVGRRLTAIPDHWPHGT